MKKGTKISLVSQLVCGVLLAAFILVQTVNTTLPIAEDQQAQSSTKTDGASSNQSVVETPAIQNSSSQISLSFESYLLDELTFKEDTENQGGSLELITESAQKAIKILFRKIISPNAP